MDKTGIIKPVLDASYPMISHGEGIYLYDENGNRYIDGSSGAVTANIGHGVEEIADVIYEQAKQVAFVYRSHFTSLPAEKLAKKLASMTPGDLNWTFFVNSGSEATETALKVAIQYFQEQGIYTKTKILSRWTSYHGITLGALSMSGHHMRRERFSELLEDFPAVPAPYCYQCPLQNTYPGCRLQCADELERAIEQIGPENIAAFIFEPIIGAAGGAIVPPPGYYEKVKEICDKYHILTIADEVMTGMGRTGKMFAIDHWGIEPDIMTLGKGLSAGYTPMAATVVSDRIINVIRKGSRVVMSGHTFSANPLSAAACCAVMEYMEQQNLVQNAEEQGERLLNGLKELEQKYSFVGNVRGKGLLCGLELVNDALNHAPFSVSDRVGEKLISICFNNGLIIYPAFGGVTGYEGDAVLISPPLIVTSFQVYEILRILDESLQELMNHLVSSGIVIHRATS
ncbi:aspartate aminotransferase family protein [Fictibacillus sp. KIGAM418]|uniref:Aspartate aminotransferase family protein n=1 Tax=Fictibacillus marinisediminis TaxID=2878389 RepID=A0A9X2BD19_9BACL|nr:aspartate aminotransferase family protein [Fictibacillus marinisediminis]MCK6257156.1 aspartate aminotransferase family protein [Fictibacillus marinisediminis]